MCIIAIFKKNIELNKAELENCFKGNPDGAGLMYQEGNHVHIEKGFMTFPDFWSAASKLPTNVDRVFHFRIATSGKVSAACCHPFPICNDLKKMSLSKCDSEMGFAHNGVLTEFTPKKGMKSPYSDSMEFGKDVLSRLGHLIEYSSVRDLIELYTTSRFAVLTPKKVYMIGSFEESLESGAFYSNTSYMGYRYKSCSSLYTDWGDDPVDMYSYNDYRYYEDKPDYTKALFISEKLTEEEEEDVWEILEDDLGITIYDLYEFDDEVVFFYEGSTPKNSGDIFLNTSRKIHWFKTKMNKTK